MYWGLRNPVTLADSEVSHYWKHFQPDDGSKRMENTENVPPVSSCELLKPKQTYHAETILLTI